MWWDELRERRRLKRRIFRYAAAEASEREGRLSPKDRAAALATLESEIAERRYKRRYRGLPDRKIIKDFVYGGQTTFDHEMTKRYYYLRGLVRELVDLRECYVRNLDRYHLLRAIFIGGAAAVPVVAAIPVAPRWLIAMFGALAAFIEGMNQILRPHEQALVQLRLFGRLARELDNFLNGTDLYKSGSEPFATFAQRVSEIKAETDRTLVGVVQSMTDEKAEISAASENKSRNLGPADGPGD